MTELVEITWIDTGTYAQHHVAYGVIRQVLRCRRKVVVRCVDGKVVFSAVVPLPKKVAAAVEKAKRK